MHPPTPPAFLPSPARLQDTKLSRMDTPGGPLPPVQAFLKANPGKWEADRSRELMYSQHVMGYLHRLA